MIVCIDYDDTYTRAPSTWNEIIWLLLDAGHEVWCVSARHSEKIAEVQETIGEVVGVDRCVGTNGAPKRDYLFRNYGVFGDVWIDDMPETVADAYARSEGGVWVTQFDGRKEQGNG